MEEYNMAIPWTPDLSTAVDEIDDQHKELISRVDSLLSALDKGRGREEISKIVQFLSDYVVFHFGNEERYMTQYSYTNTSQHLAQHAQFIKTFVRLKDRLLMEGINAQLAEDTRQLVVDWLINHIKYSDKALGLFLKRKLPSAAPAGSRPAPRS
jgi:hemerythrin